MNTSNPYAPPQATVRDMDSGTEASLAGRGVRLVAAILDGIIVTVLTYVPFLMAGGSEQIASAVLRIQNGEVVGLGDMYGGTPGAAALVGTIIWAVITYILVKRNGQTIGKKLLAIKVVRTDGSPASVARIFWLRNVVNGILGLVPFYPLVDHLFIFGQARQCLHDKIASTIVIKA